MENTKLYIISFSDSRKFRCETNDISATMGPIERGLNDYLKSLFPGETFAYYTTPRVTEISAEHADEYKDYPVLNEEAVERIKDELKREITVRQDNQELDSDAPFNSAAPKY